MPSAGKIFSGRENLLARTSKQHGPPPMAADASEAQLDAVEWNNLNFTVTTPEGEKRILNDGF